MAADGVAPDAIATNAGVLAAARLGHGRRALSLLEGEQRQGLRGSGDNNERLEDRPQGGKTLKEDKEGQWCKPLLPTATDAAGTGVVNGHGEGGAAMMWEMKRGDADCATAMEDAKNAGRFRAAAFPTEAAEVRVVENGKEHREGDGEESLSASRDVRGGWEAATPGLLSALFHALDIEGEDDAVLETVRTAREKGILLNAGNYR